MKNFLKQEIIKSIKRLEWSEFIPDFMIHVENIPLTHRQLGDYYTNAAMTVYKKEILPRGEKAEKIKEELLKSKTLKKILEKIEVAPPGFINFFLRDDWVCAKIGEILKQGEKFGSSNLGKGEKVQVEFISANPTGPLTLGNGRGGFLGDVLSNVLEKVGYKVFREFYVNDAPFDNTQIQILGKSIKCQVKGIKYQGEEDLYKGAYIKDLAKKFTIKQVKELSDGELGKKAAKILLEKEIKPIIKNLGIKFDKFFLENSLYKTGAVKKAVFNLSRKNLTYQKEGALWFKSTKFSDEKDRVLQRKDGAYTYFAADIAYHLNKFKERKFEKVIDIWGADHFGYVKRMQGAMEAFGYKDKLKIIICQLVRLLKQGREVRMSKRKGVFVTLNDLIKEVGQDVARFFFLTKTPETHLDFDLDKAKEKSEKNPVYYIQYASARIFGILAKLKTKNLKLKTTTKNLKLLIHPAELQLIKQLLKFPDLLEEISQNYEVQKLPFYAQELTTSFHNFYEKCRVLDPKNPDLTTARISLVLATSNVLKNTLDILGIKAPERM